MTMSYFSDTYNITNARGKVAKFCLFKQAYKIGDDIVGTCDFSEATIPCVQVSYSRTKIFNMLMSVCVCHGAVIL